MKNDGQMVGENGSMAHIWYEDLDAAQGQLAMRSGISVRRGMTGIRCPRALLLCVPSMIVLAMILLLFPMPIFDHTSYVVLSVVPSQYTAAQHGSNG
jgi:hypothetical protein